MVSFLLSLEVNNDTLFYYFISWNYRPPPGVSIYIKMVKQISALHTRTHGNTKQKKNCVKHKKVKRKTVRFSIFSYRFSQLSLSLFPDFFLYICVFECLSVTPDNSSPNPFQLSTQKKKKKLRKKFVIYKKRWWFS